MTVTDFYQLISPASFVAMALVLTFLARSRPEIRSALWFAATYVLAACGFLLTFIQGYFSHSVFVTIATSIYFGATALLTIGLVKRSGAPVPKRYFGTVMIGGSAILIYLQLINPQLEPAQIATAIISTILLLSGCVVALRQRLNRANKAVIFVHALFGMTFLTPAIMIVGFGGVENIFATPELTALFQLDRLISDALAMLGGFVVTVAYVTDLLALTRHDANTDPLTGLLNRRAFGPAAEELNDTKTEERGSEGLFIILADLDNFKQVNDSHGHLAGDRLIAKTARVLQQTCDTDAVIARIGGEEFIVALKSGSLDEVSELANRIRESVGAIRLNTKDGAKSFTISLGVAQHISPETLLQTRDRADEALYLAKAEGRNRVVTQEDVYLAGLKRPLEKYKASKPALLDRA